MPYGVRPSRTHTFGDQLGLVPGTKSKIEDGSTVGTSVHPPYCRRGFSIAVTARRPAGPRNSAFRTAVGAVGSLFAIHPWMAEETMKPLLQLSSFRVGHSSGLAVLDLFDTLLDRRTTPRPRRSMTLHQRGGRR